MISPTGLGIRGHDQHGSGHYGASRGKRMHRGVDFICIPGDKVIAPTKGRITRIAYPYADPHEGLMYSGLVLKASDYEIKMFYFEPLKTVMRVEVEEGQHIGYSQDISLKYSMMIPHVHLEIRSINPELFLRLP